MNTKELTNLIFEEITFYLIETEQRFPEKAEPEFHPIKGRSLNKYASTITRAVMNVLKSSFPRLQRMWINQILDQKNPEPIGIDTKRFQEDFKAGFPEIAKNFASNQINSVSIQFQPKLPQKPEPGVSSTVQLDDFYNVEMSGGVFGTSWDNKTSGKMKQAFDDEAPYITDDYGNVDHGAEEQLQQDIRDSYFDERTGDLTVIILVPVLFFPEMQSQEIANRVLRSFNYFSTQLNSVILHELEHSSHESSVINVPDVATEGVEEIRAMLRGLHPRKINDIEGFIRLFLSETEIKAYAAGYMRIAKHNKVPIDHIVDERVEFMSKRLTDGLLQGSDPKFMNPLMSVLIALEGRDWRWTEESAQKFGRAIFERHGELVKYYIRSRWPEAEWQEDLDDSGDI